MPFIDHNRYGDCFASLLSEAGLNELGPGQPVAAVYPLLRNLSCEQAFAPLIIQDCSSAMACLAGIWLHFDYLEQSHLISQKLSGADGCYWHAIMHRREPDSWNSKYWLDKTGRHPIFPLLQESALSLLQNGDIPPMARFLAEQPQWDAYQFVDLCEAARNGVTEVEMLCRRIQLQEWDLLFDYCFRKALGEI